MTGVSERATRRRNAYLAVAVIALVATATAAAVSMRRDRGVERPSPFTVNDVMRAFAQGGIDVHVPTGGIGLAWGGCEPDGYHAFLEGSWMGYATVFYRESAAEAWNACLARDTSPQWEHARRANVVVVVDADDAERVRAALAELP